MIPRICKLLVVALLLLVTAALASAQLQDARSTSTPLVLGLDHIPLAVTDLYGAAERYRELGFALKLDFIASVAKTLV